MGEIQRLELLSESIKNEIDELESLLQHSDKFMLKAKMGKYERILSNIISNLELTNDNIYGVYEELNANDNSDELAEENEALRELLRDKTDYEEREYIRIKHSIDLF